MPASQSRPYKQATDPDQVYFCQNACLTSFSGCVDEDSMMTEQNICDFIQFSNPKLHEKLNGVRLPSSYLPSDEFDYTASRQTAWGKRGCETERTLPSNADHEGSAEMSRLSSVNNPQLSSSDAIAEGHTTDFVLDRYHFTLLQHSDPDTIYCCSYPTCRNHMNMITLGECYGRVTDQASNIDSIVLTEYPRTVYYCFDCLQQVLRQEFEVEIVHQKLSQLVDGTRDREMVVESAEKIHPPLQEKELKFMYLPEEPPLSPGKDSNSKKGNRLRRQKQYDIERILRDVTEKTLRKKEYMRSTRDTGSMSPDLQLRSRRDVSPYRDRYMKQDRRYCNMTNQAGSAEADENDTSEYVGPSEDESVLHCFCREPPDDEGMVRCSAASCMFGAIHLRCSGLAEAATVSEGFICKYCKDVNAADSDNDCSDGTAQEHDLGGWEQYNPLDYNCIQDETTENNGSKTVNELEYGDEEFATDSNHSPLHPLGFTAVNRPRSRTWSKTNCTLRFAY